MRRLSWRSVPMTKRPPAARTFCLAASISSLMRAMRDWRSAPSGRLAKFGGDAHLEIAAQLDVGSAAGHVGGDRHGPRHAGLGDDRRLLLVIAGVEHVVRNPLGLQHGGKHFRFLDRGGAHEHGLTAFAGLVDDVDDGGIFLAGGTIDLVILVLACHRHVGRDLDHVEPVDVHELFGFGGGGAGHAGEFVVEAEVVLEGDGGQRDVLGLDGHVLLGLEGLVQALRIAPSGHHAAGELVDDDDLAVLDDVVLVALEQLVGAQRLLHVMHDGHVLGIVEVFALQQAGRTEHLFKMDIALLGQRAGALLLVELVVFRRELRNEAVDRVVEIRLVVHRAGDDERGAGLVHQDRVDLVDDREIVPTLYHLVQMILHVVAQIVEAEFVVGGVGHVAGIGGPAFLVGQAVDDDARGQSQEAVDLAHPGGVAAGEVVVHGHHMYALAGECIEIDRERCDESFAFTGLHLGDHAFVQHHAANQLNVEMPQTQGALGGFAHRGEGRDEEVVEALAGGHFVFESLGPGAEFGVRQGCQRRLQRVDFINPWLVLGNLAIVGGAKDFCGQAAQSEHVIRILQGRAIGPGKCRFLVKLSGGGNWPSRGTFRHRPMASPFQCVASGQQLLQSAICANSAPCKGWWAGPMCAVGFRPRTDSPGGIFLPCLTPKRRRNAVRMSVNRTCNRWI